MLQTRYVSGFRDCPDVSVQSHAARHLSQELSRTKEDLLISMCMMPCTVSNDGGNGDSMGSKQLPIVVRTSKQLPIVVRTSKQLPIVVRTFDQFVPDVRSDVLAIPV